MINTQSEDDEQPVSNVQAIEKPQKFSLFDLIVGLSIFSILFFQQCMGEILFPIGFIFLMNGILYKCNRRIDQFMIGLFYVVQLFAVWALTYHDFEECQIGYVLVVIYVVVIFCFITSSMIILT
ncbi:unnamed protein product [Paramecium primaurelia]|uniref:Uncharacterized protein n=1 Tax=Paramecium primaurelia TaxID=5886 RepID=A0A8S1NBH6_PARPR|nr:unnamed protein product [Paramecium primaurelia]